MHSVPFFTTSPTPSPTRPLHVPYTSPTSPTNTQGFCTSLQTAHVALLKMWQRLRLAWHDQVLRVASRRWAMAWGVVAKDVDASPSWRGPSRAKKTSLPFAQALVPAPHPLQSRLPAEPKWRQVYRCEKIVPFLFETGMPTESTL